MLLRPPLPSRVLLRRLLLGNVYSTETRGWRDPQNTFHPVLSASAASLQAVLVSTNLEGRLGASPYDGMPFERSPTKPANNGQRQQYFSGKVLKHKIITYIASDIFFVEFHSILTNLFALCIMVTTPLNLFFEVRQVCFNWYVIFEWFENWEIPPSK